MITARPADPQRITCEICLKEVPRSGATMSETRDYVAYFCGLACYEKWKNQGSTQQPPPAEAEIQAGHGRSKSRDDRLKRAIRQHPQRDEPKADSVEPGET
jgi:hypothetical protein